MIQILATKYNKHVALGLLSIFYIQTLLASSSLVNNYYRPAFNYVGYKGITYSNNAIKNSSFLNENKNNSNNRNLSLANATSLFNNHFNTAANHSPNIGGPSSPEASSFKPVGADNLVSLFSGDFSYNVPLLDVGGYPVNLYYSAGIGMEQEAGWVGLGWNLNAGSVSRNMRGVPDDFNGDDKMVQEQNTKPNRTWNGSVGIDGEWLGIKKPRLNLNFGVSYNNYLGPAIEIGGGISYNIMEAFKFDKTAATDDKKPKDTSRRPLNLAAGLNFKLSSRSGLTTSPSLNASLPIKGGRTSLGIGLSTSYNSRTGLQDINISGQTQISYKNEKANDRGGSQSGTLASTSISFAKPTYMPILRAPLENFTTSGQIEFGAGMFGLRGALSATGSYSESKIPIEFRNMEKPLYGFLYSDAAMNKSDAIMDFNRVNDGVVTPHTPIIGATQYAYDIFSIQGEGTGGSIRAYRSDVGFMKDNITSSKDRNLSFGVDIAPVGHFGANWNIIKTPTTAGAWENSSNKLNDNLKFNGVNTNGGSFENVYFRNPGESTITNDMSMSNLGYDNLTRFKLDRSFSKSNTPVLTQLEMFDKKDNNSKGIQVLNNNAANNNRDKRTQITTFFNAADASKIGLDKEIKNYNGNFDVNNNIISQVINRVSAYRKKHHISEINVLEQSGMRYVYGLPVYNIIQKDFTFSVASLPNTDNQVVFGSIETNAENSNHMINSSKMDGYVMNQVTPAYATAFLLTGLLNPDYVDVTGNGITEDDLGSAVKFNYNKSNDNHKWRTPRSNTVVNLAHFNEGARSEKKDNKATISYGEREVWYMNSIESKSSVAIFKTGARRDGKGVLDSLSGIINENENANKRLDRIDLYSKAEIKAKGINNARPIKTVHFVYDYSLCKGTADNANVGGIIDSSGKLTLKAVYFTYNGQNRLSKDKYVFYYGPNDIFNNPNYASNCSDRWGTYKDKFVNRNGINNMDFPYADTNKITADLAASAWSLKKILLPSGGQMEVTYEADDYGYVQNRHAANMFNVVGFGISNHGPYDSIKNKLHSAHFDALTGLFTESEHKMVYVKLPKKLDSYAGSPAVQRKEIYDKYLEGVKQLAFKLMLKLPKGLEPLTVYADVLEGEYGQCTVNNPDSNIIFIKLKDFAGGSPLVKSAVDFISESFPGQVFPGYEADISNLQGFLDMCNALGENVLNSNLDVEEQLKAKGVLHNIDLAKTFVRLNNPNRIKIGGGLRVKRVIVKDNWSKMKGNFTSTYGQDYDYTTTDLINGKERIISSGVASYEPGIGSDENPFREILSFTDKLKMASDNYGAIEMPVLESYFPGASVGYSKVTVRSIHRKGTHGDSTLKSAIGKQVSEFYTAKDYPTVCNYTSLQEATYKLDSKANIFYKVDLKRKTVSQGFIIETNDMHGKMRSQKAFSERDSIAPLTASYYSYKNTGKNGFNDKVDFVNNKLGGQVSQGNMGIDMELMTDTRQMMVKTSGFSGQVQIDWYNFLPIPFFAIPLLFLKSNNEDLYRAVSCTKLINYHAIEDSVIVVDKGSSVSTKTIAYDAETGSPLITKTFNEFNDNIYNSSYPAYWAYSGMGLAYENIDKRVNGVNFDNGKINLIQSQQNEIFESGDELYLTGGAGTSGCSPESVTVDKLWAFDKNKNTTALTVPNKDLVFMDKEGNLYSKSNVNLRIVRSGKRNMIGASLASFTSMKNPIENVGGVRKFVVNATSNVIASSAIEYKEKWQTDEDVFKKFKTVVDTVNCTTSLVFDCINGKLETKINPYIKGLVGNMKPHRSYTYYGSRVENSLTTVATDIRKNGFLENFSSYWVYNNNNNLETNNPNNKWVWNSEITKVNSKGQELETKNALNIYTAAQYGFMKNQTVAIANNSQANEMFAESFEDYSYGESINGTAIICSKPQINFNGNILNNQTINLVKTHSGNKVLSLNSNQISNTIINLNSNFNNYNFNHILDTSRNLVNPGGNMVYLSPNATSNIINMSYGNKILITQSHSYIYDENAMNFIEEQFFEINQKGIYHFPYYFGGTAHSIDFLNQSLYTAYSSDFYIFDSNDVLLTNGINVDFQDALGGIFSYAGIKSYNLCPGKYKLKVIGDANIYYPYNNNLISIIYNYTINCKNFNTNVNVPLYKDFTSASSCISSKPIPATDSMLNPTFSPTPGKKMLFSAWVREETQVPFMNKTYNASSAQVVFNDASATQVTFTPVGTIIDGWQKVEGEFTVPATATTMDIKLINNGSTPNYWDDIRMHPFNANMKSYVYDDRNLRLLAELDENNYAAFYEYDEEGQLIRVKKETIQGIKTIKETRSAKQKAITTIQE